MDSNRAIILTSLYRSPIDLYIECLFGGTPDLSAIDHIFYQKLDKFKFLIDEFKDQIVGAHNKVRNYLASLSPSQVKISITDSPSIFYTLRQIRGGFDLKFEVFCDKEIKIVFTLYSDGDILLRSSGDLSKVILSLTNQINEVSTLTSTKWNDIQDDELSYETYSDQIESPLFWLLSRGLQVEQTYQSTK